MKLASTRHQNEHLLTEVQNCLQKSGQRVFIERIALVDRNLELSMGIQAGSEPWKTIKTLSLNPLDERFVTFSASSLEDQFPTWPGNVYSDVPLVALPFEPCRLFLLALDDQVPYPSLKIIMGDNTSGKQNTAWFHYDINSNQWLISKCLGIDASR